MEQFDKGNFRYFRLLNSIEFIWFSPSFFNECLFLRYFIVFSCSVSLLLSRRQHLFFSPTSSNCFFYFSSALTSSTITTATTITIVIVVRMVFAFMWVKLVGGACFNIPVRLWLVSGIRVQICVLLASSRFRHCGSASHSTNITVCVGIDTTQTEIRFKLILIFL